MWYPCTVRAGHIPGAAIVLAAILAVPIAGARPDASAAPPKPKPCKDTLGDRAGVSKTGTPQPEPLCGTNERDTLTAVGGGDTVWGYQGNDRLRARNSKVDLVYGGPGTDAGAFDACDTVYEVETQQADPPACPGVKPRSLTAAGQTPSLPYSGPIIECDDNPEGARDVAGALHQAAGDAGDRRVGCGRLAVRGLVTGAQALGRRDVEDATRRPAGSGT